MSLCFYLCNGGVIVPKFDDPNDDVAAQILKLERSDAFQNGVIHDIREMEESGECSAPKEAGNAARTGEARNEEGRNEESRK